MENKQLITTMLLVGAMMFFIFFVLKPGGGGGASANKIVVPTEYQVPATLPATVQSPNPLETVTLGSVDPKSGYKLALTVTNANASIQTTELTDYWETYKHEKGQHFRILDTGPDTLPPFATLRVWIGDTAGKGAWYSLRGLRWYIDPATRTADLVQLVANIPDSQGHLIEIRKTFRVEKGTYNVYVSHEIKNLTPPGNNAQSLEVAIDQLGPANLTNDSIQYDMRSYQGTALNTSTHTIESPSAGWLSASTHSLLFGQPKLEATWTSLTNLEIQRGPADKLAALRKETILGDFGAPNPLLWVSTSNRFFTVITRPVSVLPSASTGAPATVPALAAASAPAVTATRVATLTDDFHLDLADHFSEAQVVPLEEKGFAIDLPSARCTVPPGGQVALHLANFLGPKDPNVLTEDYHKPLGSVERTYAEYKYNDVIHYSQGGCYGSCTFSWLAQGLLWVLHQLYWLTHNYGIAIMVLVIIVRLLMHPLTRYSQVNMTVMQKKMAKLQPEIDRVKKKYEKDKARQQQELMAVYKEHKVNPAGGIMGCLPMLLQIPIWAALWGALAVDINLRQAAFIPGWINDLSNPDLVIPAAAPVMGHPLFKVPIFGMEIYGLALLPIFLMVVFFAQMQVQMRMMPKAADPQQAQTQKISQYMILIFPIFLYNAPSGLNLYIFASTIGGLFDSWLVRRHLKQRELAEQGGTTR